MEGLINGGVEPLSASFAVSAHRALSAQLKERTVEPGELRRVGVKVGNHEAPEPAHLAGFLKRYDEVYGAPARPEQRLIAIACAHHRLGWVHAFEDGNGSAGRLVTQAALLPTTGGLWSLARGLARKRDEYSDRLAGADAHRHGELDGRGNLSLEGLVKWCRFFLEVCLEQVTFMTKLLELDGIKKRLGALVLIRELKVEVTLPLHHLFAAGPLARGEFKQLTGLGDRTAQAQLAVLLKSGLIESSSPLGPVRIGFPLDALQYLFPDLYPEAATRPDEG